MRKIKVKSYVECPKEYKLISVIECRKCPMYSGDKLKVAPLGWIEETHIECNFTIQQV